MASKNLTDILYEQADRAREKRAAENVKDTIARLLKEKSSSATVNEVKEVIKEARKPSMRTVQQFLCDSCDSVILSPKQGFIVHGNIYQADPSQNLGLVGNNFPATDNDGKVLFETIRKNVYCLDCMKQVLGMSGTVPKGKGKAVAKLPTKKYVDYRSYANDLSETLDDYNPDDYISF